MNNIQQIIKDSKFIPEIKRLLIEDSFSQLEGTFGLQKNGAFEDLKHLPNLKEGTEELIARKNLESYIKHKKESNVSAKEAVIDFTREYAFTYLNRFVAFKMMEERKIIRQVVSREYESNAFKFYLADNSEDEELWKQGKVYQTYRNFILWQCAELCKDNEIKVLFDPKNIVSQIFPRERTLKRIFELINQEMLSQAWKEDEVIGWVYQYFIEDDKAKVFDKIYSQKKKMELTDIAPATQIFTPRWIVQFLVENTLGRLWGRMHHDTKLKEKLKYYVPNDNDKEKLPLKSIKDITLLDPACGTMHFGMVAFDLFYEMYLEELENASKDGWPQKPSCDKKESIPTSIIENNIFGIDIDLRSIQLSALSLYLKAKSKNKGISIEKYNLVHTDIPVFSENAIDEFVGSLSPKYEITKKLFKIVMPELNKAYYLGSLLKIEDIINEFLSEQHKTLVKKYAKQQDLFMQEEERQLLFKDELVWNEVREELKQAANEFIDKANGKIDTFVAKESKKEIYLIDTLVRKHDIVVTNPPFSGKRNWCSALGSALKGMYPDSCGDFYTCFMERCVSLTKEKGYTGLINIHSFMFTSSYEKVRQKLLEQTTIESLVHLGPTFMELSNPYAQQCVMYSLRKEEPEKSKGTYFRVVSYINEKKRLAFEDALSKHISGQKTDKVFVIEQEKLKAIPGWPFVYWLSDKVRELFGGILLGDVADAAQGLATTDNFQFLRLWWEIGKDKIKFNTLKSTYAIKNGFKWYPYMKGGAVNRWYGNQEYIVNWENDGKEIKENVLKKYPYLNDWVWVVKNIDKYFLEGVTYSFLTISNLSVRYLPEGFIFDVAGSSIFPKKTDVYLLLGILNSKISTFLIKILNPTVNYQVGDMARIPYPDEKKEPGVVKKIIGIVKKCIDIKQSIVRNDEISWEFTIPMEWDKGIIDSLDKEKEIAILETENSKAVYELHKLTKEDIKQIENEFGKLPGQLPKVNDLNSDKLKVINSLYFDKHVPSDALKESEESYAEEDSEQQTSNRRGRSTRYLTFEEICLASGFHPETVFEYIKANKLEREEKRYNLAVRYVSYALGVIMGRFKVEGIRPDDDGITVIDEGHNDDAPARVKEVLNKVLNEKQTEEVESVLGGDLRKFLRGDFFTKYHVPMYKKRPVYWLLRTAKKNYGFYIYNLKFAQDTLYSLVRKYLEPRIKLEKSKLTEQYTKKDKTSNPKDKRNIDKLIARSEEFLEELEAFKKDIQEVIDTGYKPNIDDGVILNMAPLYKLVPWKEPEKYFKELQKGEYEWATISKYFTKI